jgi:hypothetical protein
MKINFTLETVELNKGMTARRAQANLFGSIGNVKPGSQKHIRILNTYRILVLNLIN